MGEGLSEIMRTDALQRSWKRFPSSSPSIFRGPFHEGRKGAAVLSSWPGDLLGGMQLSPSEVPELSEGNCKNLSGSFEVPSKFENAVSNTENLIDDELKFSESNYSNNRSWISTLKNFGNSSEYPGTKNSSKHYSIAGSENLELKSAMEISRVSWTNQCVKGPEKNEKDYANVEVYEGKRSCTSWITQKPLIWSLTLLLVGMVHGVAAGKANITIISTYPAT